jgi:3-phosphoshikimate 1-carboxyvinyltransferase
VNVNAHRPLGDVATVREDGNDRIITPRAAINGTVQVPGDKSISQRLAMLAALADGESSMDGFLAGEDCLSTLGAMASLGARVTRQGAHVSVVGAGGRLSAPAGVLDLGNSGTGMRLLCGLLAGHDFESELTGDASLRSRPMGRIAAPLRNMGARVALLGANDCAPIRIHGGGLRAMRYRLPMASAQVKSCVLLAGLFAEGETIVEEPKATRDHTERLLRALGADCRSEGLTVRVHGAGGDRLALAARNWSVPGDFSAAAFWMGAAAMQPGAHVLMRGVGINPRRTAFLDVLRRMGANVEVFASEQEHAWEPFGAVAVQGGELRGTEVAGDEIPNLIDELPMVAVIAAAAEGQTVIRDAQELRVKETDRIAAMVASLRAFGIQAEDRPDGMIITGGGAIRGGGTVDSRGDHRIAMAGAILALQADASARIRNVACVATSYPAFWMDLMRLTRTGEEAERDG